MNTGTHTGQDTTPRSGPDTGTGTGTEVLDAVVVGAGPSGLATAASLASRGVRALVLDEGGVAAAWSGRYTALRLNSGRPFSTLPGQHYPRGTPMFPDRDAVVRYLEDYSTRFRIPVRPRTPVSRIDRADGHWALATPGGRVAARQVVVATGLLRRPVLPPALTGTAVGVPVVHSAQYRDPEPYRDKDVLVAGPGSSGMEIAHELVDGGAGRVRLSVRTPPTILPRSVAGMPGDPVVLVLRLLPPRLADAQVRVMSRTVIGDLSPLGLPAPDEGPFAQLRRGVGAGPALVDREVIDDLRSGRIEVVGPVTAVDGDEVVLGGTARRRVDAVVAATGFRPGLEPLVGHLDVLDGRGVPVANDAEPALPGLRFVNFRMRPGLLGAAGGRARRTAAAVAADLSGRTRQRWRAR